MTSSADCTIEYIETGVESQSLIIEINVYSCYFGPHPFTQRVPVCSSTLNLELEGLRHVSGFGADETGSRWSGVPPRLASYANSLLSLCPRWVFRVGSLGIRFSISAPGS